MEADFTSEAQNCSPEEKLRFQVELEFVQCLGNPNYLNFLAQQRYFHDKKFINYLNYLYNYWKTPEYSIFLSFPQCLYFLELLQHESFRNSVINKKCTDFIHQQQFYHWQHYYNEMNSP
eukprot:Sdes_comp20424_c0_seq1m14495